MSVIEHNCSFINFDYKNLQNTKRSIGSNFSDIRLKLLTRFVGRGALANFGNQLFVNSKLA